ncbi:MAG: tetratricopeptide repeat protein [Roseburia sp.]
MKCFNCGAELTKTDFCPNCGIQIRIYKKIVHTSNFYYNQGLERANVRDLSGAAESLRKSLRFQKGNIMARNLLGLVLFEMGETVTALGEWVISKSLMPEDNDAEKYLDAIQKNPARLETINQTIKKYNQALLYCRQNSTDLAIIQLKKVLSLNPKLVKGHQLLALLYMKEGQYERAKKSLRAALKVDSANTLSLRYMRETNQMLREANSGKKKKQEDDLISYRSGNDLIIQPTRFKDTSGFATVLAVLAGIVIGVAVTGFLVVPSIRQNVKSDANAAVNQANETIASKNQEIASLENQIAELNNRLESEAEDSDALLDRITSYDQLLLAYQEYQNEDNIAAGEALATVNPEHLSDEAKSIYDDLSGTVNSQYVQTLYDDAATAYNARNYEAAAAGFEKVAAIDENYENGDVLYFLAQCYRNLGQNEDAITYYQKVVDQYPNTQHAANAQQYLAELQEAQ